jgi:hypothetical protein
LIEIWSILACDLELGKEAQLIPEGDGRWPMALRSNSHRPKKVIPLG